MDKNVDKNPYSKDPDFWFSWIQAPYQLGQRGEMGAVTVAD